MVEQSSYNVLDDPQRLQEVDSRNMLRLIDELPEQCETALGIGSSLGVAPLQQPPNAIVIIGAGECVVAADMLQAYLLPRCHVPIVVLHQPILPACVGPDSIVVILDYSLKNPLTRSTARLALAKGARLLLGVSQRIDDLEEGGNTIYLKVPAGQPERTALGYRFVPTAMALHRYGLVPDVPAEVSRVILHMKSLRELYRFSTPTHMNPAKQLAQQIAGTVPVIYGPPDFGEPLADRWRNQICFNAKTLACSGRLPDPAFVEIGDSEVSGQSDDGLVAVILSSGDDPVALHFTNSIKGLTGGRESLTVDLKGANLLEKLWQGVYLGDYVSCYLALLRGTDPWYTGRADLAQERLSQWRPDQPQI